MNRIRLTGLLVSLLALAGLAAHAQIEPVSSAASAASPAKAADGSETWPSGLVYRSLRDGSGPTPSSTDVVKVHYRGTFPNGTEFDSSYTRGQPAEFPLNRVIACWTEGVQKMKVGGKARLTCPPSIAYGTKGAGGVIPPNATLNFDVELIGIAGR
ncbi:FKBP-type peptidyl-prolyl cis-trans isomerase [Ideonella sp.]|uniref:FKBP-type peptidyl-prolyl cis-trans isomerase n=1 Tax=Ideonella sp. TaxID=1929293 RepID=UPI002B481006|nr:FKBP-type peptidyl-prolyl cis-trans isomerase [Ideonella sp.]